MIKKINPEEIKLSKKFQGLCKLPYHGHSNGCPNYGKKEGCPPQLPLLDEIFDFKKDLYVIYTSFPIGKFAERMRLAHPEWKEFPRQWYNPRLWQHTARKEHKEELKKFLTKNQDYEVNRSPEAHGVNVTELMKSIGIELRWEWPPKHNLENISYIISMGGVKK